MMSLLVIFQSIVGQRYVPLHVPLSPQKLPFKVRVLEISDIRSKKLVYHLSLDNGNPLASVLIPVPMHSTMSGDVNDYTCKLKFQDIDEPGDFHGIKQLKDELSTDFELNTFSVDVQHIDSLTYAVIGLKSPDVNNIKHTMSSSENTTNSNLRTSSVTDVCSRTINTSDLKTLEFAKNNEVSRSVLSKNKNLIQNAVLNHEKSLDGKQSLPECLRSSKTTGNLTEIPSQSNALSEIFDRSYTKDGKTPSHFTGNYREEGNDINKHDAVDEKNGTSFAIVNSQMENDQPSTKNIENYLKQLLHISGRKHEKEDETNNELSKNPLLNIFGEQRKAQTSLASGPVVTPKSHVCLVFLQNMKHGTSLLVTKQSKITFPSPLLPASDYNLYVCRGSEIQNSAYMIQSMASCSFHTYMTQKEVYELYKKAVSFIKSKPASHINVFIPIYHLYRNKSRQHFHEIWTKFGGVMYKYIKNMGGDPGSTLNRNINGLFFSAHLDPVTRMPPDFSFYGDQRIHIPVRIMMNDNTNLYFADFYCHYKNHHVTLVLTLKDSAADIFCRDRLITLNPFFNEFLYRHFVGNHAMVNMAITVEVFYTESINIASLILTNNAYFTFVRQQGNAAYKSLIGVSKNKNCKVCNL